MSREDEIRERAEAATSGPWTHVTHREGDWSYEFVRDDHSHEVANSEECFTPEDEKANFEFIALAREDVPYLLARVRELEGSLREANVVIHAEGYDDPHDKLRSLAVIAGFALDGFGVTPEEPKP